MRVLVLGPPRHAAAGRRLEPVGEAAAVDQFVRRPEAGDQGHRHGVAGEAPAAGALVPVEPDRPGIAPQGEDRGLARQGLHRPRGVHALVAIGVPGRLRLAVHEGVAHQLNRRPRLPEKPLEFRQIPQDDRHRRSPRQLRVGRVAASAHTRCPELSDSHDRLSDWARPVRPHINRFDDLYPGYESQRDGETRSCPGIGDADRAESCRPSSKTRKSSGKVLPRPAGRRPIRAGLTPAPGWRVLPGCCCSSSRPSGTPRSPSP